MPPFIPQKRRLSSPPSASICSPPTKKPTLFQTADTPDTAATLQENRSFLDTFDLSEDESSLTQISSDHFEDALPQPYPKNLKAAHDDDDDDQAWEDAIAPAPSHTSTGALGNIELNLDQPPLDGSSSLKGKKKGPSKIERQIRVTTHCMHVQFLLFHNAVRNGWACDAEVQSTLVSQVPTAIKKEIERWKIASGIDLAPLEAKPAPARRKAGRRCKNDAAQVEERNQRDWGKPAQGNEKGLPNMSSGDPVIRLLKVLAAYWKKRYTITAPGLRKQGYRPLSTLEKEITSFKSGAHDVEKFGECINGIEHFRRIAVTCEGSRDVGAQLFTSLVRGLGLEARLIGSLQCVGFGWGKNEEALDRRKRKASKISERDDSDNSSSSDGALDTATAPSTFNASVNGSARSGKPIGGVRSSRGAKSAPIEILGDSSNSSGPSVSDNDDKSVVDVTPSIPRYKPNMNYDRDLSYPVYWTEVISPITNKVYPVESLVLNHAVATNAEHIAQFEPRGAKAERAKQIFAYVVAHSLDGSAKDVTIRYLKRHSWPGRTKGVRMPIEKVPVYNHRGKIQRHEDFYWFKTVMSGYVRTSAMRTAVDDIEEETDLKIMKPEKPEVKAREETLQGYKNSAEYVLERHLRREEALIPGAKPVKSFAAGKGDKLKQEPVYRRKDVEICRTGESWHKEGRAVKAGEHPLKMVPVRAVTLTRKREVEEAERDGDEKLKQGLYAWDQTDWIIPPPIENGVIPKNGYGNMDCFVPTMVPKGAIHIPLRSTTKICKRMGIDYAEAVTGFEFGNKRAVPVITGVVVSEENEPAVVGAWEKDEEERRIKEEGKRERTALSMWRKWLMGLRIVQRVREEYGESNELIKEELNPFTNVKKARQTLDTGGHNEAGPDCDCSVNMESKMTGGSLTDGGKSGSESGGFFPDSHEEDVSHNLILEDGLKFNEEKPKYQISGKEGKSRIGNGYGDLTGEGHNDQSKKLRLGLPSDTKASISTAPKPTRQRGRPPKSVSGLAQDSKSKASRVPVDSDETAVGSTTTPAKRTTSRAVPKRNAARKSARALKSHYFEHSSDESEEDGE